jgi:sugar/nucleoside kinase (ribokinase family)
VGAERFLEWTGRTDLMLPNADEAAALTGEAEPETAARTLTRRAREVVVTLGARGALWTDGTDVVHAPAAKAGAPADTTGAGDAFAAGFLVEWIAGATPAAALRGGCALAARAIGIAQA